MKNNEITKRPDMGIFDKQFPVRLIDAPIDDPTKFTILTGDDGILDDLFSYQVYNHLKNHWRGAAAPADIQDGMIWSETVTHKLYHEAGGADEEILQLTRSDDVTPEFLGLLLAEYITHVGDANTYFRFQVDQITLRVGGVDFINMVEAGTDYLQLLDGLNFIGDDVNTKMTVGLTLNQAGYDDEILAFKSSDVAHGMTTEAETDTFGLIKKFEADNGGIMLRGFGEDKYGVGILAQYTTDDTGKSVLSDAPIVLQIGKKDNSSYGPPGANANLVAIQLYDGGWQTRWILDEDGDTWQDGNATMDELISSSIQRIITTPTVLTIAAGAITVTKSYHIIDGQGGAADNLDTINGGVAGMKLTLTAIDDATTITVRDGAGNIELQGGANHAMGTRRAKTYLFYDAVEAKWVERGRFTG